MSFQGDVAGIGLGELLQGLTRGGRDGVLTLDGEGGLSCFLGMQRAQIFFLPGPTEDTDVWRERCQRAWADSPEPNLESKRRASIAHATRRELLFRMLEAPNLHFRFEPGAMPSAPTALADSEAPEGGQRKEQPWGPGYSVEFLLLDHARIQDESGDSLAANVHPGDMPRALDLANASEDEAIFLGQCDGSSTLEEISDRLGWPLRQTRGLLGEFMAAQKVRISEARELLVAGQRELELGRIGRASARLARWIDLVPAGPLFYEGEAELLIGEWEAERLLLALNSMEPRKARGIMRRLDFISPEREDALDRWQTLRECNRRDSVLAYKCAVLSVEDVEPSEETEALASDLLHLARSFQDKGHPWRARPVLRLAATQVHRKLNMRLELGARMLQVGLVEDATPVVLDAAREQISTGNAEKAIPPLRALSTADPNNREAAGLLLEARAHKTTVRRKRRNVLIGASTALVLATAAMVHVSSSQEYERRIEEVTQALSSPEAASALLEQYFVEDDSPRVEALRNSLATAIAEQERQAREDWLTHYRSIEDEMTVGDPMLGLQRALDLPKPPLAANGNGDWPTRQDLLGQLAKRLEETADDLDFSLDAPNDGVHEESRLVTLLGDLIALSESHKSVSEVEDFRFFVGELDERIRSAQDERARIRQEIDMQELEAHQDRVLLAARAHAKAGDLERAVALYDQLLATPGASDLVPLLDDEIDGVRRHYDAVVRAEERARDGDHAGARAELEGVCEDLSEHLFPWRVESEPTGARVRFRGDSVRVTPFVMYSSFGETVELHVQMEGTVARTIRITDPRDIVVPMFRLPERAWQTPHAVDAAPVPVGEDHIVTDRSGRVVRLAQDGGERWATDLDTLGGIARTPVFLPRRPGYLLLLSEDGKAWMLRSSDGHAEGPYECGSPPVEGPVLTRSGVSARFADDRVVLWTDMVVPHVYEDETMFQSEELGTGDGAVTDLVVLRRSADQGTFLEAPWHEWTVEVEDDLYRIRNRGEAGGEFSAGRVGEWTFVAWEAPNALVPGGRLWVSDGGGLRAFRPNNGPR